MDYEKAYNELIGKLRDARNGESQDDRFRVVIDMVIPELKESEDEMIRKTLIHIVKGACDKYGIKYQGKDIISEEKLLAWLEKLGDKAFSVERVFAEAGIKPAYKDGDSWCVLIGKNIQEGICGFGETPKDAYVNFLKELWNRAFQTPVHLKPEFKPKFKVGDWVVVNGGRIGKIIECTKDFADVALDFSCLSTRVNNIRLWTIQDAKDGDMLATENSVFMFKHMDKTGRSLCKSYCEVIGNSGLGLGFEFSINGVYPAAKEQRDLLFQKMKEAGYEWDAEKKELKKVEQKPAWSEEDERMLNKCIEYASNIIPVKATEESGLFVDFKRIPDEKAQDWLKSLKDRVRPQWKPSDKQIGDLEYIMRYYPNIRGMVNSIYTDLKKL